MNSSPEREWAHEFLPLRPVEFHILLALSERETHGCGIVRATEERSGGSDVRLEHLERLGALPGVTNVAAVDDPPLGGHSGWFVEVEGAPPRGQDEPNPVVLLRVATPGYLEAMGVTLLRGRDLTHFDGRDEGQSAMLVNETFVDTFIPGEDPIGRRVHLGDSRIPIVGVTRDVQHYGLHRPMPSGHVHSAPAGPALVDDARRARIS